MLVMVLLLPTGALSTVCMSDTAIDSAPVHNVTELFTNGIYNQYLGTVRWITSEEDQGGR